MSSAPLDPGIHRVLAALDLGEGSDVVFAHAMKLALATGATLTTVHVRTDPSKLVDWTAVPSSLALLQRWGLLGPDATDADVAALELHVDRDDRVAEDAELGIIRAIIERLPNVIVLGTHARRGLDRLLHGSVAEAVARRSGAVTLVLPTTHPGFLDAATGRAVIRRVLFPIGGEDQALQHAVDVMAAFLEVLRIEETSIACYHSGAAPLPELSMPERRGWDFEAVRAGQGDVVDNIVATVQASAPDLVVMATRGHDSLGDLIAGSRTERVVRRAGVPVLVVPLGQD